METAAEIAGLPRLRARACALAMASRSRSAPAHLGSDDDSIAAWLAGVLGASRPVVVKPAGAAPGKGLLDDYFERALPPHVTPVVVPAGSPR